MFVVNDCWNALILTIWLADTSFTSNFVVSVKSSLMPVTTTVSVSFSVAFILLGEIVALVEPRPFIVIEPLDVTDCPLIVRTTS